MNIGKAVDKLQGNEREVVGEKILGGIKRARPDNVEGFSNPYTSGQTIGIETKGTSEWEGWGTALKPALEPITVARKPLAEKTVAENVLKYGTGGINIDGSRVGTTEELNYGTGKKSNVGFKTSPQNNERPIYDGQGRFPANLIHDGSDEVVELFPDSKGGAFPKSINGNSPISFRGNEEKESRVELNDNGSAARFFYCPKASKSERNM